jgi:hypothetical protein
VLSRESTCTSTCTCTETLRSTTYEVRVQKERQCRTRYCTVLWDQANTVHCTSTSTCKSRKRELSVGGINRRLVLLPLKYRTVLSHRFLVLVPVDCLQVHTRVLCFFLYVKLVPNHTCYLEHELVPLLVLYCTATVIHTVFYILPLVGLLVVLFAL